MSLAIGQILQNRYRILRQLGQGGMGSVWLAEDLRLVGRRCAIKANIPEANADAQVLTELRNQFYVEAKTLGALDHSNLPKVSDYFTAGDSEYLVMDFVEGENLQEVLDRHIQQFRMPLPEQAVLGWIDQVLDALEYLHRQRPAPIIHRDIKPGNIILTPTGVAKLVDFGLVKLLDHTGQSTAAALRGMGTPAYTALEQYPGNESHTDARTDLYALGATLYHLLTGTPPANVRDRLLSSRALEKPRRLNTKLSTRTEAAILKAIEVHPDQRFQTASQMRAALGGNSVQATVLPRKRGWAALIVMLFVFSLLAITVLAWINGWILPPTPTPTVFTVTIVASETATDTPVVSTPTSTVEPTTQPTAKETAIPTIPISTPTSTRAPTDTPTNIPTATPAAPMAVASGQTNLRAGPGTGYPVVGSLTAGREVKIIGKNEAGTWWQLDSEDGESVWVIANLVETTGAVDTVEVVAAPPTPTTAPTATPARPGLVADFEGGPPWPTGNEKYGSLEPSHEQVRVGSSAARLSYDFPAVVGNYVVFLAPNPIPINGPSAQPTGLTMWVYGDSSNHFLNAWVQDKEGEVRAYSFGTVSHSGWKQMTAWFDDTRGWPNGHIDGINNGILDFPVRLYALVLDGVPDGEASSGVIYIDDLMATQDAISVPATPTPVPPPTPAPSPATRGALLAKAPGTIQTTKVGGLLAFGTLFGVWLVADRPRAGRRRKGRR